MKKLTNWIARRSGAGMTIYGIDVETGKEVRTSGVTEVSSEDGKVFAVVEIVDRDDFEDVRWELVA